MEEQSIKIVWTDPAKVLKFELFKLQILAYPQVQKTVSMI